MRRTALIALLASASGLAHAESALSFVDLRVHGGLAQNDGAGGHLTLMAGDIGNKSQSVLDLDADMGIVIGLRADFTRVTAKITDVPDTVTELGGGSFVGGLGFYVDKNSHVELLASYGKGWTSTSGTPWGDRDGAYTTIAGELGWYYTMGKHYQLGVVAGWSQSKLKLDAVGGGKIDGVAQGVDAGVSLGYRF
jgi:hypothetical protein